MKQIRLIGLLVVLITISACSKAHSNLDASSAFWGLPANMYVPPDDYPESYKEGWKAGCESGLSVYGGAVHKAIYNFNQEVERMKNVTYSKAWVDSFNYCRAFINRSLADGLWWGEGFGSRAKSIFEGGQTRERPDVIEDEDLLFPDIFGGLDTPGHGAMGWQDSDDDWDWLGRAPEDIPAY